MPDQTLLRIAVLYSVNDHVGTFILLIACNNLELSIFAVRSEERKELEQIQNFFRRNHVLNASLHCSQTAIGFIIGRMPRAPLSRWHAN